MPSPFPNLPPEQRGTVHSLRHQSDVLADNPWGDPTARDVLCYTPPGWQRGEQLPVITCLIGFSGTGEKLLARSMTGISIATRIDRLISDGCPPFIALLPDCMTSLGGSQYVDSEGLGNYASYVCDELQPFVAETLQTSGRRGVLGHSSGGFGALHLAMNHPDTFQAVACHAGDMGFELCYLGDLPKALRGVATLGGLDTFVPKFWALEQASGTVFAAINILCMACAYSPDALAKPIPARLPINFDTGEVDLRVFERWLAFDPLHQVKEPAKLEALRKLEWLYIDCGNRDEYNLQYGARRMSTALKLANVAHVYEEFSGGHGGTRYRWDTSLLAMAKKLSR